MGKHNLHWHHFECGEVLNMLGTSSIKGLSTDKVQERQKEHGKNILTKKKGENLRTADLRGF